MQHAFTVDVEDWYQGLPLKENGAEYERRLDRGMNVLLDMLDEFGVKATFFWLGPAARLFPGLLRRTIESGHEIGSHGWSHELVYSQSPDEFRDDIEKSTKTIQDIGGCDVKSYRAPYFSITPKSFWALETLIELGYDCDSSVFPINHWRCGIPDFPLDPCHIETPSGWIWEVPMSVRMIGNRRLPAVGGAYFRIYPYEFTRRNIRALEETNRPAVFYIHPWELDPRHPRIFFDWKVMLTHYFRLSTTRERLRRLLSDFSFTPLGVLLQSHTARTA